MVIGAHRVGRGSIEMRGSWFNEQVKPHAVTEASPPFCPGAKECFKAEHPVTAIPARRLVAMVSGSELTRAQRPCSLGSVGRRALVEQEKRLRKHYQQEGL